MKGELTEAEREAAKAKAKADQEERAPARESGRGPHLRRAVRRQLEQDRQKLLGDDGRWPEIFEANEEKLVRRPPNQGMVQDWVQQAKALPRVVSY